MKAPRTAFTVTLRHRSQWGETLTAREVMNWLRKDGWAERPGRGSHVVFSKPDRHIIVPNHGDGHVPAGTLRAIARAETERRAE